MCVCVCHQHESMGQHNRINVCVCKQCGYKNQCCMVSYALYTISTLSPINIGNLNNL